MTRVACPGSFDPVTMGHLDVIERAAAQFDEVIVLVTANPQKPGGLFAPAERVRLIREVTGHLRNVTVDTWGGLLVDYTTRHGVTALVKGLRSVLDYEYELPMAQMNRQLTGLDTFFLVTDAKYSYVSSTLCKEVAHFGGDLAGLLPDVVVEALAAKRR